MRELLRVVLGSQAVQAVVRDLGDAQMRLARVGVPARGDVHFGENFEQRCLAHLRQADDSSFHGVAVGSWPLALSSWLLPKAVSCSTKRLYQAPMAVLKAKSRPFANCCFRTAARSKPLRRGRGTKRCLPDAQTTHGVDQTPGVGKHLTQDCRQPGSLRVVRACVA